jgi:hypothetical protein
MMLPRTIAATPLQPSPATTTAATPLNHHQQQWQRHSRPSMPPPLRLLCLASAALQPPPNMRPLPLVVRPPPPPVSLRFSMPPLPSLSTGTPLLTSDKNSGSNIHLRAGSSNVGFGKHTSSSSTSSSYSSRFSEPASCAPPVASFTHSMLPSFMHHRPQQSMDTSFAKRGSFFNDDALSEKNSAM